MTECDAREMPANAVSDPSNGESKREKRNRAPHGTINGVPIIGPLNEHEFQIFDDAAYDAAVASLARPGDRPRWWLTPSCDASCDRR